MLKEGATIFRRLMIFVDLCLAGGAFFLAYYTRNRDDALPAISQLSWFFILFIALWGFFLYFSGMYSSLRLKKMSEVTLIIYQAAYFSFFTFTSLCYALRTAHISRLFVLLAFIYASLLLIVEKVALVRFFRNLRKRGFNYKSILIVGTGERARHFIRWIDKNKEFGLKIVGLIAPDKHSIGEDILGHAVIGTFEDIPAVQRQNALDSVLFAVPYTLFDKIEAPIHHLETVGVKVDIALDHISRRLSAAKQTEFCGVPLLSFESAPEQLLPLMIKRLFDIVVSAAVLVLTSPVFAAVALLIKTTSRGPVFFVQERGSLNGRTFKLYKFRTMVVDAEARLKDLQALNEMKGPAFKVDNDPRVTKVGGVLRKFSIDELPQLWNVFKGDMSLVGPRPPLINEVAQYDDWHRRRLSVRPGITCLWQVNGRNKITDFAQWAKLDLEYIDNWSLWLDLKILFKTVPVVLLGVGAK
jgi:exopolysaccharide biosynthesis polyprenyl glycosylphosphotransferase